MSYIHIPHDSPLEHRPPFQLLKAHVSAHPNKEAFVFRDLTDHRNPVTFQDYDSRSQAIASGLLMIGLKRGDRVLLMLPSCPEFVFFHMALNRVGALAIISQDDCIPAVKGINKLNYIVSMSDYDSTTGQQTLDEIHSMIQEQDNVKAILIGYKGDLLQHDRIMNYKQLVDMATNDSKSQEALTKAESQVTMDDPFVILFTSGSSGAPKPIELTNHCFVNGCIKDAKMLRATNDSRVFNDNPFDWSPGLICGIGVVIVRGSTHVVFPPKIGFKGGFTSNILKIIAEEQCTVCFVLPYFLHDVAFKGIPQGVDLSKLEYCITGGQPLNLPITKKLLQVLPSVCVVNGYGSTETQGLAAQEVTSKNIDTLEPGLLDACCGYELKVIDPHGQLVPHGTKGELCVRAAWVAFPNPDVLVNPPPIKKTINHWHHLSDCCSFNPQGQLKLFGRMDFLIKCATESIQPCEVEDVLCEHPDVDKVCVCGIPDPRLYQKICACIIMKSGKIGDKEEFQKWSDENFEEYSLGLSYRPHHYLFMKEFPLTRTGKLCRRQTQQVAIKLLGL